jgi:hypothetical protein
VQLDGHARGAALLDQPLEVVEAGLRGERRRVIQAVLLAGAQHADRLA